MTAIVEPTERRNVRPGSVEAAQDLAMLLRRIDRVARREARTRPRREERQAVLRCFWRAMRRCAEAEARVEAEDLPALRAAVGAELNPWFLRSRYWNRSFLKPHGYAGDYLMLEWMYDLERDRCADATQPAVVNLLDGLYSSVHSVRAVWFRRAWFARLLRERVARAGGRPVRVLDIACGGSRYVRDVLAGSAADSLEVTFVDQDPAALAFVNRWLPAARPASFRTLCAPVRRLDAELWNGERFDVVVSTGLFDYLSDDDAVALFAQMRALAAPAGVVAVTNFAPEDASKVVKDWVSDWRLIYRSAEQLRRLIEPERPVRFDRSPDGGLILAAI
jgi:SAM-dependent methyltransferase